MLSQTMTTLVLAAAGGAALAVLFYLALRNGVLTVALLLGLWIVTVAVRDPISMPVTVGTLQVFPADVLSVLLAGIGVARAIQHGVRVVAAGLGLALLVLLVLHLGRGIADSGAQLGLSDGRQWLYFLAPLAYAATVPSGWDRRVWKVLILGGVAVSAIGLTYLTLEGLAGPTEFVLRNGELASARPITAAGALLVLQVAVIAPVLRWPSRTAAAVMTIGAAIMVVLLQHRTIWVAGLLVLVVGSVWWAARQHQERIAFLAVGTSLLLVPLAIWAFISSGSLVESVAETTSSESTFAWRTAGWDGLISSHDSLPQLLTGDPSGSDWSRQIDGVSVDVSAHNGFVDAYIRFGVLGVLILCWLGVLLWLRRRRVALGVGLTPEAVGLLLLTQLVFSIAYSLDAIQGLIIGILISGLLIEGPAQNDPDPVPTPSTARS